MQRSQPQPANEIVQLLEASALRVLQDRWDEAAVREAGAAWPAELWRSLSELGLQRAMVAEERAGAGLTVAEGLGLIEAIASYSNPLPLPLPENMLAGYLLDQRGITLPDSMVTVAPPIGSKPLNLRRSGDMRLLSGRASRVPWGHRAQLVLLAACDGDQEYFALVETGEARADTGANLAGEPRDMLHFTDARVAEAVGVDRAGERLLEATAALRTVQISAACRSALVVAIDHARTRNQFGRPIAKFQAVQLNLAVMADQTAAAAGAADLVTAGIERESNNIAAGKARASEAAGIVAAIAHQTLAAMGFTEEFRLHRITKRLLSWRDEGGSESFWSARLGRAAFAGGSANLWRLVSAT